MHMHDGMCSALEGEGVNRKLLHFGLNTDNIGIEPMPMLSLNRVCEFAGKTRGHRNGVMCSTLKLCVCLCAMCNF